MCLIFWGVFVSFLGGVCLKFIILCLTFTYSFTQFFHVFGQCAFFVFGEQQAAE